MESAVLGRLFAGDPFTELGCVMALGNDGCNISPLPELIVRCGGRLGAEDVAPEAVDAAASVADKEGSGDSGRAVFAAVDGRG